MNVTFSWPVSTPSPVLNNPSPLPIQNWEEVATYLNSLTDEQLIADLEEHDSQEAFQCCYLPTNFEENGIAYFEYMPIKRILTCLNSDGADIERMYSIINALFWVWQLNHGLSPNYIQKLQKILEPFNEIEVMLYFFEEILHVSQKIAFENWEKTGTFSNEGKEYFCIKDLLEKDAITSFLPPKIKKLMQICGEIWEATKALEVSKKKLQNLYSSFEKRSESSMGLARLFNENNEEKVD